MNHSTALRNLYYHLKRVDCTDKCEDAKAEITAICHEYKGRCGYRRITIGIHECNFLLNYNTVQWLTKELGLACQVRMKKYRSIRRGWLYCTQSAKPGLPL